MPVRSSPSGLRRSRLFTTSAFGALALAAVLSAPAYAQLNQGAAPAQSNGSAPTIDQSVPNTTTVTLGGSRTVIDWDKFDINSGERADFIFANRSDIVLNRVGGAGSTINGDLNGLIGAGGPAGGNIWIYNANGVVIGANARINTGGLLVTTAAIDRADDATPGGFLDGSSTGFGFTGAATGSGITVRNGAQVNSHGGAIALVSTIVTAEAGSSIAAQDGGNVLIGSAAKYKIRFRPTSTDDLDLLSFEVASGADGGGTAGPNAIDLAGNITGNRVFVAAVSKSGLAANILSTGTITAVTAATDETGAIILSANHNIVNSAVEAAPVSGGTGTGFVTTFGGALTAPAVTIAATEGVMLRGDVNAAGGIVDVRSDNGDIRQFSGVITAGTVSASARTGINFNSFSANRVDKLGDLSTATGDLSYIGDEDGVELTGVISAPGKVTLGARGFIDTTTGSITASSLELFLGGGGLFKVNGDANLGNGLSNGAVTVHATGGITLANEFAMNLGDPLSLTADTGAIRETGGFISGGGAVVANAAGEIDLGGANSFTSLTANSTDGENITVNATGNLDFKVNTFSSARFTVGGDATSSGANALIAGGLHVAAGGAINLSSDGGDAAFGDLSAGGNITLAMDGNLVVGGVIQAGGALSLTSRGGAIRQTSGTISLGTSFTLNAVTGIDLNQTGNHLGDQSLVSVATGSTGSNVRIRGDAMKLYLHGALGAVSLYGESGDVVVGPGLTASSLTAEAARDIQVGSNGNTVAVDTYHRLIGTNVSVYNNGDFTVDGDVGRADVGRVELVAPNGTLTQAAGTIFGADISLRATYAIKQDSGASVQGSDSVLGALAGTDLLLAGANRFGYADFSWGTNANVTIRSVGNLYVDTGTTGMRFVPVHTLKLISDEGSVDVDGGFIADTLNVQAHGDIMLDDATYTVNKVGSVTGLTSATGNISLREDNGFDINGDISAAAGNITLRSDGAIETYSGALSLGGTLAVTAGGGASLNGAGAIKLGAVSTSGGGNFYLGSDGNIELTGAIDTGTSTLILSTANGAITSNGGTISAWSTTAYATGAITLVGSGFANFWATSTGGGDIHLSGDTDVGFAVNTSGDVIVESGNVASNTGDMIAGSMSITAVAGINLTDPGFTVDVGSFSRLRSDYYYVNVDIQGDIKLDGDVFAGDTGSFVSLKSGGSILQNSGTIAADRILLSGTSAITQASGAALHGGALSLTSNGNVTLDQANAFTSIADLWVGGDLTLRNLGNINLDPTNSGGYSSGGALTLTSDTGDISAGNIVTTSKLTASAVAGNILLGGGSHQIDSLGTLSASGNIEIGTAQTGFGLTGDITATNLTLLTQNSGISQSAGTKITAGTLNASANGNITLDQANAVTTVGGLNANLFTTGHNISFRNGGGFALGGVVDASGGTLRLTSNTGGITQNSGASIYVRADQLFLSGASDILLNNAGNNVATLGGASSTSGGILYRDANGFDIAGNITANATNGGVALRTAGAGTITQSGGIIDVDYLGVVTTGNSSVTLDRANRIGRLIAMSGSGTLSINSTTSLLIDQSVYFGTVSLRSGGAITQSNTGSFAAGTANLSAVTGINLPGASLIGNNSIQNFGTISNTTSGGINIVSYSGSQTSLTGNISAAGQTVSITDVAGHILQTGGVITADTLNLSATGGINVGGANQVSNLGAMSGAGLSFANAGSFNVTQSIDMTGAHLNLASNSGAIIQNGGTTLTADTMALNAGTTISQGAGATLHATSLSLTSGGTTTLGEANDFTTLTDLAVGGDLTLRNLGNINLSPILGGTGGYRSGGALTLISDTGNILTTNSGIATSRLNASAAGSISLDGTIASLGTITAGQSILLGTYSGSMDLTGNVTGRSISLYADTGLSQSGGIIDADRLNVITNGAISLTRANQIDVVGRLDTDRYDFGTGHDITLRNVGAIVLDYQIEAPGGTVTLTSDTGGISQTSFSDRFIAGTLNASAAGDIVLDQAANNVGRVDLLRTSTGGITFHEADGFDIYGDISSPGLVKLVSGGAFETYAGHLSADTLEVAAGGAVSFDTLGNIKLGAVDTSGGGVSVGGAFYLGSDSDIELTGAVNTGGHNLTLYTSSGAITRNGGTISAIYNGVSGVTYATATGGIDLASVGNAVIWATSTGGGNINLIGDGDLGFRVETAGDLSVTAGGWAGNNSDVIARSVGIAAGTGISLYDQTVTVDIGSYRYLTVADGFIDIENKGDINLDGNVTTGGSDGNNWIRLNSTQNSVLQNSGMISGYGVEMKAARSVTQDVAAKVVAGDGGLSFAGTDVTLVGANIFPWLNTYSVSRDLTLRAVGTLDMSGSSNQASGGRNVTLISDTGNIIGGYIDADKLSATATNGKLVFTYGNNKIRSLGALTAKSSTGTDIDIFTDSTLGLTGDIIGGGVNIYATQGINQTAGAITAARLATGTSGNLLLGGANDFGALLDVGHGHGATVTIRNRGSIALPSTPTTFGTLTLTSDTGSVSQTNAITAATLDIHAATGIDLSNTANNFTTLSGLVTAAGDIRIGDSSGFAIEGDITASTGTVALTSTGIISTGTTTAGSVTTPHGKIDADTLTVSGFRANLYARDDIRLGNSNVTNGLTVIADRNLDLTGNVSGAAALIATTGSISQSGGSWTSNSAIASAAGDVTLLGNNNLSDFSGLSSGGGTIRLNNGSGAIVVALSTTGNAILTVGGNLTGIGVTANDLSVAAGHIDLTNSVDVNSFSKLAAAYGDVLVTNNGSFTIAGDVGASKTGLRTVDLRATGGAISQTAGTITGHAVQFMAASDVTQTGTASVDANVTSLLAGNLYMDGANRFGTGTPTAVRAGGTVRLNGDALNLQFLSLADDVTLSATAGDITVNSFGLQANSLTASASGQVTMTSTANQVGTIYGLRGTHVSFINGTGFTLDGDVTATAGNAFVVASGSGNVSQVAGTVSGSAVTLRADTGSILQSGTGAVVATTSLRAAAAGDLLLGGANNFDSVASTFGYGPGSNVTIRNLGGIKFTGGTAGALNLTSDTGAITQTGAVTANSFAASAATGIDFSDSGNSIAALSGLSNGTSGGVKVASLGNVAINGSFAAAGQTVTLTSGGAITQNNGGITANGLSASAVTGIALTSTTNHIASIAGLSNSTSGGIRVNDATGDLDLAGAVTAGGQAVRFDTAGRLTQSAALGAYSTLAINAGTGLILDQANNFGTTTLSLSSTSGDIMVRNTGNLNVPALSAAGATIRLISDTGSINQTGLFIADTLFAEARREISLGGNNVITNVGGLVNTSGTITFRDIDGFNIIGDIRGSTTTGERVNLTAGGMGDIVQIGGAIVVDKLRATAGGNLTLDGNANRFINVEVLSAGGDIRLRAQDSFVLGHTLDAGGTMTLTSTNGFIGTDLGSIGHVRANALYVNAATGIDINLPANITPRVSLISAAGNIRYTTQGAMELLALRTADRAVVSADALTQSGAIEVGSLDALAGDIRFGMAGNRIGSIHYAVATGGDVVIADDDGFDIAGNLFASGAISLTAGGTGSITQSDGTVTASTVSLVAAGGNITLDRANAAGVYNARSAIGGAITLRNAGNLTVDAITARDGTVNLASNTGSVSQLLVPDNSIWAGKLNVDAATDIDLAAQNITGLLGNLNAGGSIRYNSFNTLGLDGDIRAVGGVTFGISGYLGQYSGTIAASHLDVNARGIALIGANDIGSATASNFSAGDDITFRSINSILLGAVTTPGLLSLTSDGGGISQTAAFSAGRLDAIAAGDIVLDQLNTLDTVNDVTAGGVFSLRTSGALELDGRVAAADRVTFNTGGGLTQIGNTVIVTDRLEAMAGTTTATGIRLLNHNRVGAVSFDAGGNDIRFRNTGNIAINAINAPTGTVELIANLGKITQQASGGLVAGSLILDAGNGVELYNSDNQIARLDVTSRGDVSILTGGSGWGGLLTVDRIDAAGKAVSIANYVAGTTGGNITAASLTLFSADDTDLGTINDITGNVALSGRNIMFTNRGNLVLDGVLSSLGNAVLRSEEGAISQTNGSALFDTTGLTAYGRDGVTITGGIRRIDGLSAGAGADVAIVSSRPLELAGDISARNVLLRSNASPGVLDPAGGAITQTGGIVTADLLRGSAYGAIDLGRGNQIAALGEVLSFTGGIAVTSARALDLTGALTAANGDVVLDAASISQSGGYIEAVALDARAAGSLTLDAENAIAAAGTVALSAGVDIAFRNGGSFVAGMIDAPGLVSLASTSGSIAQALATSIEAGTLTAIANGGITLDQVNQVTTLGAMSAGADIAFSNAIGFAVDGDISADGLSVALTSSSGAITQTGGVITAGLLSLAATDGIDFGAANQVDALTAVNSGGSGNIRFVNGRSLTVNNLSSGQGDLALRLIAGQLILNGGTFSLGDTDIEAAGGVNGIGGIDSRKSVRVAGGGSIDLVSVTGRDDILIDAGGDAAVRQLVHLSGTPDAAGNGYTIDILGNNVTLGASDPGAIGGVNILHVETSPVVRLGARAGNATLNLAAMDRGVSIAATGDVRAYATDDLGLVDVTGTNVTLTSGTGDVYANRVDVAGNYSLAGRFFYNGALQPLGTRSGNWMLTTGGNLDASGRALEYGGDIDFTVGGALENGSIRSLTGSVTIAADVLDLYQITAATGIDARAMAGDLDLFAADTVAGNLRLSGDAVRVSGSLEAGADISIAAASDAVIGYATAGRNIAVAAGGDAALRQANLTGATGDLTIGAGGNAVLGDDGALTGIGNDRWFERVAGSTGTATITGGTGAFVNLDHSARLDNINAEQIAITIAAGDFSAGQLTATTHGISVDVASGSLMMGGAAAANGTLDLIADGDLTLLGGASGLEIYLAAGGLLDTRAGPVTGTDYVELTAGAIRAGTIGSGGDIDALSTAGAISVDGVHSTGGNAIFNAYTDLGLGSVIANGGQLQAGGNATVRAITAPDGFALVALGDITLGADAAGLIGAGNLLATGGNLGGCACGSGGATLISLDGNIRVNLQSATGIFDTIAAAVDGDAGVHVVTGDLGIGDLAAHNIAVTLPGGTLTLMNAVSSGGDYMLTARDFGGNALTPVFGGGATMLNNVSITDTDGDFGAGGTLVAAGDIRISSVGNITDMLSLLAGRDIEVTAKAIRLGNATGRDVILAASVAGVDVVGAVTVGRSYTLTGSEFSANALAGGGARSGDLLVTDTAGDFAYGALALGFAGTATIRANGGAIRGGDIATLGNLDLSAAGIVAGTLRSDQGGVRVDSSAAVDLAGIRANNVIDVNADGDLRLGNAELTGTGVNSFTLAAGGDLSFGAADAASIGSDNAFTSAGSAMTGGGLRADGQIFVNLDRAAALTGIDGGTLELTVRNGNLSAGNIRTVGAMFVTGPSGTLSIGDAETSAGHIGIAGQGNVTTGAVKGHFVIDISSSAGSVAFRKVAGGDVTLAAATGITAIGSDAGVFANSLGLTAGGDVDLATNGTGSRIGRLRAVTVANGGFALHNLQGLALDNAIDVRDGTLDLQLAGALSQTSGAIVAQHLAGNISGHAQLGGANHIASLGDFTADGLLINNATALGIEGIVDSGTGSVTIRSHGGMTIGTAGAVHSASTGDAITLASDGLFRNLGGGAALAAASGRWLVYAQASGNPGASDPANAFGGLAGLSFYGAAYDFAAGSFGSAPGAGNRFVYGYRPVLTVRPNDLTITYNGQIPVPGTGISGLINGDSAADAWSGAASLSGAGRNVGTYTIAASLGSLASDMNYDFAFDTGTLRIDPRAITATLAANSKVYDGTTGATGTLSLDGLVAGDDVTVAGAFGFADKNAGAGKTVTVSGIALNGTDAGNYTVNLTATGLADILARTITATLLANGKTYDSTAAATGTLSLGGVLADDDVRVSGALAFADKNAGIGKIVTANGIALSGGDAGNYVVNATATGLADILARTITATLVAYGKTYDGTAAAAGALSLAGVLAGDTVNASGDYAFADKNAATGKTVTASGITLGGADAGNYTVNATATGLADILARAITATLAANGKTYDGTTAATGTISLGGVLAGDQVGATGSYAFADKNAGTGKTVTASGITLGGADAGNYVVDTTATGLADILARAITATLAANGKTYDGTTAATGMLSLGGVLAGDQVGVTGGIAFDSRNAGERIVTANGLTLNGADAGNYIVNGSATDIATIARLGITGTAVADSRIYDGTVATTGRITLGGVLAGDAVSANAGYAFADPNAGAGRVVAVSGLALTGADAGNYAVALNPGPVLADILLRPVTVRADDLAKIFGMRDPALTWRVTGGSLVGSDAFTGSLGRAPGEQAGLYAVGQGSLALSSNYALTLVPGSLTIRVTQSGADASEVLKRLRPSSGFSLYVDPSANLQGDVGRE